MGKRIMENKNTALLPVFKWTGGKRKEIKNFVDLYPSFIHEPSSTYVEPFAGGAAVYWNLNSPGHNVLNDFDADVANFYQVMAQQEVRFLDAVQEVSSLFSVPGDNHDAQEKAYYHWRNLDRDVGFVSAAPWVKAARFFIITQLAFSGMRRFNSRGEFNVPFGHYKHFNASTLYSTSHADLLSRTLVTCGGYENVLEEHDNTHTFIFCDPPYTRVMKKYSAGDEFGEQQQRELADRLLSLKDAHFMLVIDKSDLTMELYGKHVKRTYALSYGVNIRNRFSTEVEHLVVTNY